MDWIAVADNDISTFQVAGQILLKQGMRVTGFPTGPKLLDFLRDNQPDLILLGSVMWELGGFEAAQTLKRATGLDLPVVFMAEQEDADFERQAREGGAAGVVTKPLAPGALIPCVCRILGERAAGGAGREGSARSDIEAIATALEECNDTTNGMWMGKEAFSNVYHYMLRWLERYHDTVFQVLFTLEIAKDVPEAMRTEVMARFKRQLQGALHDSDMMLKYGENQFLLILPEAQEANIGGLISRSIRAWKDSEYGAYSDVAAEARKARLGKDDADADRRADWVVIVDDDVSNLKMAGTILSKQRMRVTALKSGRALLDYVKDNKPDVILLDIRMPEMDGFETLRLLKEQMAPGQEIPVIFLSADDNAASETKVLELGAMDFIRKPFVPDVLTQRVRHTLELVKLQKNLAHEVEIKTQENESLSLRVVQTLAEAIDAKDTYTNGHSGRVAQYARQIAKRFGYNRRQQDEIYMMGLLHDVGKIGVPDSVINKPGKLTDAEYAQIKTHPVMGDKILKNIRERPKLAVGARWHHERYDGRGYPDGLRGEDIPEEARIIAVADAYDAMTSRRSYRGILPQEAVRREIEKGKGTQFDPTFADIMLQIIAEDKEYRLKEGG